MKKISGRYCEYCKQEGRRQSAVYDVGNFLYLCAFHAAPWLVKASEKARKSEVLADAGGEREEADVNAE